MRNKKFCRTCRDGGITTELTIESERRIGLCPEHELE